MVTVRFALALHLQTTTTCICNRLAILLSAGVCTDKLLEVGLALANQSAYCDAALF
jgi:hypothetical protein